MTGIERARWRATLVAVAGSPPPAAAAASPGQLRLPWRPCRLEPLHAWLSRAADPYDPPPRRCSCGQELPHPYARPRRRGIFATGQLPPAGLASGTGIPPRGGGDPPGAVSWRGGRALHRPAEYAEEQRAIALEARLEVEHYAAGILVELGGRSWRPA